MRAKMMSAIILAAGLSTLGCSGADADSCGSDSECKGDRICSSGECVSPGGANNGDQNNTNPNNTSQNNTNPNNTSQNNTNPNNTDPNNTSPNNSSATVNGVPADEYYAQFHWDETSTYASGAAAFEAQADGRNAFLTHVFLYESGDAVIFYEEGEGEVTLTGHSLATYSDTQTRIDTQWTVDGVDLVLGDVFTCGGFEFNGQQKLRCVLDRAIITDAAIGSAASLSVGISASSPDDSDFADF